jgi:hypothetical protein
MYPSIIRSSNGNKWKYELSEGKNVGLISLEPKSNIETDEVYVWNGKDFLVNSEKNPDYGK